MTCSIRKYYKEFREMQWWTKKELEDYQLSKLKKLGENYNIQIDSWDDFKKLPLTTKEDIANLPVPNVSHIIRETSGSTGEPLTFYLPKENGFRKEAIFRRHWDWAGLKRGLIARFLSGKPQHPMQDRLRRVKPLNFRDITKKDIDWLIKYKPKLIHCTVFTAREIIEELEKRNETKLLKNTILWWSAQDTTNHKKIAKHFFKDVFEGYGLAELTPISTECEHHKMHTIMETGIIEVIDGEIVVTDFNNYVTPIIRYRTGDHGRLIKSNCKCGRVHPILIGLKGRRVDYYSGPEVKRPISWWICSPLSHTYNKIIRAWRIEVLPKEKKIQLFIDPIESEDFLTKIEEYMDWLIEETGLSVGLTIEKQTTRWKHKLLIVK